MTDQPDTGTEAVEDADSVPGVPPGGQAEQEETGPSNRWRARRPVRSLRRVAHQGWDAWDQGDNEASRLPDGEEVHLAGLVLAETFTPSTVSTLYRALASFPASGDKKKEWADRVTRGRSAAGMAGWVSIGPIRRAGEPVLGGELIDPTLPASVEATWAYLFFPAPSLTVLVTTFTLTDEVGDLSPLLRADYRSEASDVRVRISGHLGWIRARIPFPWSRPKIHQVTYSVSRAEDQKRQACESLISAHETACQAWLAGRFPGTFSATKPINWPVVRLLLTKESVPFEVSRPRWLTPPGLAFGPDVWRSTDQPGWAIKLSSGTRSRRFAATAAARRRDAVREPAPSGEGETTWLLTQQFALYQSPLVARWAIACLLSLYADRLAEVRDRAARHRRVSRPVRQARNLDGYLLGDGLDASTVAADMRDLAENLEYFRRNVPEYTEDLSDYPEPVRCQQQPQELVPWLRERLQHQGLGLERDIDVTTRNISASAGLRQAIANTRLQRMVLFLTVIAIAIAVISLVVALHADATTSPPRRNPASGSSAAESPCPGSCSVQVLGHALEPAITCGSLVLIEPITREPHDGELAAAQLLYAPGSTVAGRA